MQRMLKDAKPDRLEDLIAMNALYRPGPMDLIPTYIARKQGKEVPDYPDPRVKPSSLRASSSSVWTSSSLRSRSARIGSASSA